MTMTRFTSAISALIFMATVGTVHPSSSVAAGNLRRALSSVTCADCHAKAECQTLGEGVVLCECMDGYNGDGVIGREGCVLKAGSSATAQSSSSGITCADCNSNAVCKTLEDGIYMCECHESYEGNGLAGADGCVPKEEPTGISFTPEFAPEPVAAPVPADEEVVPEGVFLEPPPAPSEPTAPPTAPPAAPPTAPPASKPVDSNPLKRPYPIIELRGVVPYLY